MDDGAERARCALAASGMAYDITSHGRVGSLEEAAHARGVEPGAIIKTLVVRRGEDDHLFVLVPGDREISWPSCGPTSASTGSRCPTPTPRAR